MHWRVSLVALAVVLLPACSMAAEMNASENAVSDAPATVHFDVIKDASGRFVLKRTPSATGSSLEEAFEKAKNTAPKLNDWFIVKDPQGQIKAIFGADSDAHADVNMLKGLPKGSTLTKTDASDVRLASFIDPGQTVENTVKATLTSMVNAAVDQVCGLRARPTSFSMDAEVKIDIGVGGSVKMGMRWDTKDLCPHT